MLKNIFDERVQPLKITNDKLTRLIDLHLDQIKILQNNKYFINIHYFKYVYKSNSKEICGICHDDLINSTTLTCPKCHQQIHKVCIETWLKQCSHEKTCIYCVSNIWNRYVMDYDTLASNDEYILLSKKYNNYNNSIAGTILDYEQTINDYITEMESNNKQIEEHKNTFQRISDKLEEFEQTIIESFQSYKTSLKLVKDELKNTLSDMDAICKMKKFLKFIKILQKNINDKFVFVHLERVCMFRNYCEGEFDFYSMFDNMFECDDDYLDFIRKYENNFRNYKNTINVEDKNNYDVKNNLYMDIPYDISTSNYRGIYHYSQSLLACMVENEIGCPSVLNPISYAHHMMDQIHTQQMRMTDFTNQYLAFGREMENRVRADFGREMENRITADFDGDE